MTGLWKFMVTAAVVCLMASASRAATTATIEFEAKETYEGASAIDPGTVTGLLTLPEGEGPFPAVVLLHGCAGLQMNHEEWAEHLASWGYASLRVDSFGPRGIAEICTDIMRPVPRVADVNGAMDVLKADDRIDGERIAVMGFSHGAQMTLLVAGEPGSLAARHKPDLKAAIAFYPYCPTGPARYSPPLMILIGDADDWTPADPCISLADGSTAAGEPIQLVVYEGATHSYDCRACDGEYWGHTLIHNPEAHEDSIQRVHDFLVANLGAGPAPPPSGQSVGEGGLRLDASSLEAALVGSTTEGINAYGNPYTVHILADGKTTGVAGHNNEYVDDGTWWVEGDMYCRRWNQWLEGATGCFNAVIEGDKIRWLNADGSLAREETYTAP